MHFQAILTTVTNNRDNLDNNSEDSSLYSLDSDDALFDQFFEKCRLQMIFIR